MVKHSKEKEYAKWLMAQIKLYGLYPKAEAINGGAMALDVSPVTTARYLNKLSSAQGEFKIVHGFSAHSGLVSTKDFTFSSMKEIEQQGYTFDQCCRMQKFIVSQR